MSITPSGGNPSLCPPNHIYVPISIPPYFICAPPGYTVSAASPSTSTRPGECYNVYSPVITVYNKKIPVVYQTVAFTFDIYTETAKIPLLIAEKSGSKNGAIPPSPSSSQISGTAIVTPNLVLDTVGKLLVNDIKKVSGVSSVTYGKIENVLNPLCNRSYILFRARGSSSIAGEYKPITISGREHEVIQLIAGSVVAGIQVPSRAYQFRVASTDVQFVNTPSEFTSLVYSLLGVKRGGP